YELLFGSDDLPDAMVGRLPARTPAEVTAMVDRIIAHDNSETFFGAQNRPAIFTTDYDPDTVSPDANYWPTLWIPTGLPSHVVNALDYVTTNTMTNQLEFHPDDMKAAVHAAFEVEPLGPSLFFYFGHGNYNVWGPTGGQYFGAADIASIVTANQWPMVLTFTCFNGYYAVPGATARALGEEWLLQPLSHGAVADVASAGIDYYDNEKLFSIEALELMGLPGSNRPKTIGELITRTRIEFITNYPDLIETKHIHLLFGDPNSGMTTTAGGSGFLFD
ncbi:MAG: C25 family cysteine peptidase, partial [Candidatus Sumerlaeota bacterium]